MPIVNSNRWEILVHDGATAPLANAANATFKTVGHATSVSFESSVSNIPITSKASRSQMERIAGQKDSSGSVSGYIDLDQAAQPLQAAPGATPVTAADTINTSELFNYIQDGTTIYLRIGIGNSRFIVPALASGLSQTGGTDATPEYSFDWEQAGAPAYDVDVTA